MVTKSATVAFLFLTLMSSNAVGALILSLTNANQTASPGAHAVFHGSLLNNGETPMTIVSFVFLNPPSDTLCCPFPINEPAVPLTLPSGGFFSGVISEITVPLDAIVPQTHGFAISAATNLLDSEGNTFVSNMASGSLTVVIPEPNGAILLCVPLTLMYVLNRLRAYRTTGRPRLRSTGVPDV
jgi:hypothetical protein